MSKRIVLDRTDPGLALPVAMDAAQRAVVDHDGGPLRVIAGPGTGKTATIVEAMVARLSGPDPLATENILGLTFGRKAAKELRDRVTARVGGGRSPVITTFHAFAYALANEHLEPGMPPLRLLSGAEEDVEIREQIRGTRIDGTVDWPDDMTEALDTMGFAREVRAVVARARERGIDSSQLAEFGRASGNDAWVAIGQFMDQYIGTMSLHGATDYAELISLAIYLLETRDDLRDSIHRQYRAVYVDEYQDTDPAQVHLLKLLTTPDTTLVVVGDPDQAIYGFRGADRRGIIEFPQQFRRADSSPAPTAVLNETRRFGAEIRNAATLLIDRSAVPSMTLEQLHAHRHPVTPTNRPGTVQAFSFLTDAARADFIANRVRRWHAEQSCDWGDIAVIVRATRHMRDVRRALNFAGIPVAVSPDDTPLWGEPVISPLVLAMNVVSRPQPIEPDEAETLLTSWLAGADVADLRRLGRALRHAHREAFGEADLPGSRQLLARALREPDEVLGMISADEQGEVWHQVHRLAALLSAARRAVPEGAGEVAWILWSGEVDDGRFHSHPERLRNRALRGGVDGRRAEHDLDCVIAFFELIERSVGQLGVVGVSDFVAGLRAQAIPAEPFNQTDGPDGAVHVVTAHRSKGLQWRKVIVVGAEEGVWPDVRPRGSVLHADMITEEGVTSPPRPAELLDEERRLFYVAMTRGQEDVILCALESADETGDVPSRFIFDAGVELTPMSRRGTSSLNPMSVIAELREAAIDVDLPAEVRRAATKRLAWLIDNGPGDLGRLANPDTWWHVRELTHNDVPVTSGPISISGSALDTIVTCPLKWFLERKVNASVSRGTAMPFGSIVHAVAEYLGKGEVAADLDELDRSIDPVWSQLVFEAPWQSRLERDEARQAIARLLEFHQRNPREVVATEQRFEGTVSVPSDDGGNQDVFIHGSIDRIEQDDAGVHLLDFKTGASKPSGPEVEKNAQLGLYQTAVAAGLIDGVATDVAGAELIQLRMGEGLPLVQTQSELSGDPTWVDETIGLAADIIRHEGFDPQPGKLCKHCVFERVCPAKSAEVGQ